MFPVAYSLSKQLKAESLKLKYASKIKELLQNEMK